MRAIHFLLFLAAIGRMAAAAPTTQAVTEPLEVTVFVPTVSPVQSQDFALVAEVKNNTDAPVSLTWGKPCAVNMILPGRSSKEPQVQEMGDLSKRVLHPIIQLKYPDETDTGLVVISGASERESASCGSKSSILLKLVLRREYVFAGKVALSVALNVNGVGGTSQSAVLCARSQVVELSIGTD